MATLQLETIISHSVKVPAVFIESVYVSKQHKLASADSIIYTKVLYFDAVLWTSSKHFQGLP